MKPNTDIGDELDAAALRAGARGAPEIAADVTPEPRADDRQRRRLTAVHCRYDSGDYAAAGAQADAIGAGLAGDCRAEALLLRAAIAWSADDASSAVDAATHALEAAARPVGARSGVDGRGLTLR